MADVTTASQSTIHDTEVLPAWWSTLQRHVFMAAFVLASGFIIAEFLTSGLGVASAGQSNLLSVGAFAATAVVGGLCGGMTVLCSVATKAYWDRGRKLLSLFAFGLMVLFGLVEFYAGLVDRLGNVPVNKVDAMILSWLGLSAQVPITPTQIVIAASVSLIGIAWGFAQYQPPKVALEDAEEEHRRKMQQARHAIELRSLQAGGVRQVTLAARGKGTTMTPPTSTPPASPAPVSLPVLPPLPGKTPADGAHDADIDTNMFPHQLAPIPAISRPLPGSRSYPGFVAQCWGKLNSVRAGSGQPVTWADLVAAVGDTDEQVRAGVDALRLQETEAVPAGRRPRKSNYQGLYDLAKN